MSFRCVHCGTALIGTVNRCWKCGQRVTAPASEAPQPAAAATSPATSERPAETGAAARETAAAETARPDSDSAAAAAGDQAGDQAGGSAAAARLPSPFAAPRTGSLQNPLLAPQYPRNLANRAGGYLSLLLGVGGIVEAMYIPVAAAFTAVVGLFCGLWGMRARRRTAAGVGMALCCIALAWGTFNAVVDAYRHHTGRDPFAPNVVVPEGGDPLADEFDGEF